jgi:small nuclear ribonucleoprotein (snRNP)-like protein
LDKVISLHLNKNRKVSGTLRGYDQYMNIVLSDAFDETSIKATAGKSGNPVDNMGMIVSSSTSFIVFLLILLRVLPFSFSFTPYTDFQGYFRICLNFI